MLALHSYESEELELAVLMDWECALADWSPAPAESSEYESPPVNAAWLAL